MDIGLRLGQDTTQNTGLQFGRYRAWWKFGFPVFYVTDLLQLAEAFVGLGYETDSRLSATLQLIHEKQDSEGRWPLEYEYTGKTWLDFGQKNVPNKWVTLRTLRILKALD